MSVRMEEKEAVRAHDDLYQIDSIREKFLALLHATGHEGDSQECPTKCSELREVLVHLKRDCVDFEKCQNVLCKEVRIIVTEIKDCKKIGCRTCQEVGKDISGTDLPGYLPLLLSYVNHTSDFLEHEMFVGYSGNPFRQATFDVQVSLREHFARKLSRKIYTDHDDKKHMKHFAKMSERIAFEKAGSREEYYGLIAQKMESIAKDYEKYPSWLFGNFSGDPFLPGQHENRQIRENLRCALFASIWPKQWEGPKDRKFYNLFHCAAKFEKECFKSSKSQEQFYDMVAENSRALISWRKEKEAELFGEDVERRMTDAELDAYIEELKSLVVEENAADSDDEEGEDEDEEEETGHGTDDTVETDHYEVSEDSDDSDETGDDEEEEDRRRGLKRRASSEESQRCLRKRQNLSYAEQDDSDFEDDD